MAEIVTPAELAAHLDRGILPPTKAASACRVASGWLYGVIRPTVWPPVPIPDDLWGWALELAAMAYDNPTGADSASLGDLTLNWGAAARERREQILAQATAAYGGTNTSAGPQGSFPDPEDYPDPAYVRWPIDWLTDYVG